MKPDKHIVMNGLLIITSADYTILYVFKQFPVHAIPASEEVEKMLRRNFLLQSYGWRQRMNYIELFIEALNLPNPRTGMWDNARFYRCLANTEWTLDNLSFACTLIHESLASFPMLTNEQLINYVNDQLGTRNPVCEV